MMEPTQEQELRDRLSLIESMIAEGRRKTESWGWTFVLWGVAYYVAIGWATWGHSAIAWPVTMVTASALTAFIASRRARDQPETTAGRSITSIWLSLGITLFLFCFCGAFSGHSEQHMFLAVIEVMLGGANATSSFILKWKAQFAAAVAWWIAGIATLFVTTTQSSYIFLAAIFVGQIVFGSYMMIAEAQKRKSGKQGVAHA
jgi:hypothetical protein